MAGGEVVEPDDGLVELEQGFQQVGADEAGDAGDEPGFGVGLELALDLGVAWHFGVGGRGLVVAYGVAGWAYEGWMAYAACPLSPGPSPAWGGGE